MKKSIIKCRNIVLFVFLLVLSFSVTAFATETNEQTDVIITDKIDLTDLFEKEECIVEFKEDNSYVYTGNAVEPEFDVYLLSKNENNESVKNLLDPSCYSVEYSDNVNAGAASLTVTGKEAYSGSFEVGFTIEKRSIDDAECSLSTTKYTYNGKEKKPTVTIEVDGLVLEKDKDYKVTYSNNVEVGTAKVIIIGEGNYTDSKEETYKIVLGVPKISTTTAYDKVTVKWNKITGAKGYIVQRSTSKTSGFETIKKITSGSTVKYVDDDVTFNERYYYRVKAYRTVDGKTKYGEYSTVISRKVRPAQVTDINVLRKSTTSLKIKWGKVSGATGYLIYRSRTKDGTFERVGEVKSGTILEYVDDGLTCGRRYYYQVKAYRKIGSTKYAGEYSAIDTNYTRPSKAKWSTSAITYNSTYVNLRWNKSSGADGYVIYRATSKNGTYKKVKTITSGSTTAWKNTGLTKGKVYYYKVRAYCKQDGKTVYGAYSDYYKKRIAEWRYSTYDGQKVKRYYNAKGELVKDVSNIIGKQKSYVIKVNKRKSTVTVYAKDGKNGYIIPVKAFRCSPGYSTPEGTFYTPQKLRWHELMGPCWGQWCTRISGSFLFHSVFYNSYQNNLTLSVSGYNKLGTICSHGCVRLTAGDAKWIYDNCKLKTKVIIYNSSKVGPLGKPATYKLPYWHTWDPTDPNVQSKCKARGCH